MSKKIKLSKLAIVLFLTILIWVWADMALDENLSIFNATIVIGRTKPSLLVSFPQGSSTNVSEKGSSFNVNEIKLKGPASKINSINEIINNEPEKLEFPLEVDKFKIDKPGEYQLDVKEIIEQSNWINALGLSVEGCDPNKIQVNAVALSQKDIDIQCFDKDGLPRDLETPQKISMYVPLDWGGAARVVLSDEEINRATKQPMPVKPYINLPNGLKREADKTVEIKLSPQENLLGRVTVVNVSIGFCFSENLSKGQYKVDIDNMTDILNFEILTTQAAKDAYEEQKYQVMLEIVDDDINKTEKEEFVFREIYYLLPEEFVRLNQIKLAQDKETAKFKVTPLAQPETP